MGFSPVAFNSFFSRDHFLYRHRAGGREAQAVDPIVTRVGEGLAEELRAPYFTL